MGKFKDYLIDFDYLEEEQIERIVFKKAIKSFIIKNKNIKNDYLEKFLRLVIPKSENDYWLFINDKETYCNICFKYEEYISAIQILIENADINLYFSPVAYNGVRKDKNALFTNCIYVDIDDVGVDISGFNKNDILSFLIEKYNVPESVLPCYISKSGHGLHLFFATTTSKNSPERESYVRSLTTYFNGDLACIPISHVVRVPLSYNVKKEKVRSELFEINTSTDYSMERLNYFLLDNETIENYYKNSYEERTKKSNETRRKNQLTKTEKPKEPKTQNKKTKNKKNDFKTITTPQIKKAESNLIEKPKTSSLTFNNNYKKGRPNYNLLLDLHNFFVRHKGEIAGYRNNFVFIYSNVCKKIGVTINECKTNIDVYFPNEFNDEAKRIIENTYKKKGFYKFTNFKIAELLNFDENDVKRSYSAFSEERKIEAAKQRNKRKNEKLKNKTKTKKDETKNFVRQNLNLSTKELAKHLQISERTIQRIKKEIANHQI